MSSAKQLQLSMAGAKSQPVTDIICLGLLKWLSYILYKAEFDDIFCFWWNTTDNGSYC